MARQCKAADDGERRMSNWNLIFKNYFLSTAYSIFGLDVS